MTHRADDPGARIELTDVGRTFRSGAGRITALEGVSFEVAAGQIVAVTGPSGSGKSTLLHVLGAIERVDTGQVVVDGLQLAGLSRRRAAVYRQGVGFVFQRFNLLASLTALDNVVAPVLPRRVKFDKRVRARELLEAVGLASREAALPGRLSGGEQQRVAIARALIGTPRLLLADEPTGNLDSSTGQEVLDLIIELRERFPMTIVVATHDPAVAGRAERVIQVQDGRVLADHIGGSGLSPSAHTVSPGRHAAVTGPADRCARGNGPA